MKWPWERRELAVTGTRADRPAPGADGADGDAGWWDAFRSDDANPLWQDRASRFRACDEMRKSSPSVKSTLLMMKLPMRAATWSFTPPRGSTDPTDKLVADACSWLFGLEDRPAAMSTTWDQTLSQALLKLDYGCMFGELIWKPEVQTFRDADGDEHLVFAPQRIAPRYPRTVDRIESDPVTGLIAKFTQNLPGTKPIPPEKLVVHVLEREGDWFGTSLLRPMYGPWKLQKELMVAAGIGWDRFAAGIPWMKHPDTLNDSRKAKSVMRGVRSHEHAYVTYPTGGDWDWGIESGAGSLADPTPLIRLYSEQIAQAGLQQFSSLGTSAGGNRALGEVLIEPFFLAVQSIAGEVAAELLTDVVRPFVDANFGQGVPLPTLGASRIAVQNIATLTQAIADLSTAGFRFDDLETQNDIRSLLEMRPLEEAPAPPAPTEGAPPLPVPPGQ